MVQFVIKRFYTQFILCICIPCIILIIVNYILLWLPIERNNLTLLFNLFTITCLLLLLQKSVCMTQPTQFLKTGDIFVVVCVLFAIALFIVNCIIISLFSKVNKNICKDTAETHYKNISLIVNLIRFTFPVFYLPFLLFYYCLYII